ncbi:MAG: hypothetical protein ACREL5_03725 [Gemmatimonadales bacterium]
MNTITSIDATASPPPGPSERATLLAGTMLLVLLAAAVALKLVPADATEKIIELFACLALGVLAHFMIGSVAVGKKFLGLDITAAGGPAVFVLAYGSFFLFGNKTAPLSLDVTPNGRSVTVAVGDSAPPDSARVTVRGTGAATTRWYAMHARGMIESPREPYTGSRTIAWRRDTKHLAPGRYVDTLYIYAPPGKTASVVDTVNVVPRAQK